MMDKWFGKSTDNLPLWERDNSFLHACIAYFVAMLLFVGLRIASGLGWFGLLADSVGEQATEVIATCIIQIIIFFIVPLVILKTFSKQSTGKVLTDIGFNRPSGKVIGYSFLLGVLLYFLNMFVASISTLVLLLLKYRFPASENPFVGLSGLFIGILVVGVLPGVCEEFSNRGVLMRGFISKLGVWRAVLLSSLIFGLMHLNIVQTFYAFILGIFMALAILATRSIWAGIIIHFTNNAMSQLFSHAQSNNWAIGRLFESFIEIFNGEFGLILFIAFAVLMYTLIVAIIHKFARENYKANEQEYFAVFLKNNPEYVSSKMNQGQAVSIEDMSRTVENYTNNSSKFQATRFYLEGQHKPQKLNALEKTLVFGILFLTVLVTGMTLAWGALPWL